VINNKKLWAALGTAALLASAAIPALAADTGVVTATVTPQLISVSVSPGSVAYGTLALSVNDGSRTTKESGTITATNDGNVTEKFNIKGSDATGGSTPWTLSDTPADTGTVAANQYVHDFSQTVPFDETTDKSLNSVTYKELAASVAVGANDTSELQMNMPTSSTDASAQKSTTVTVQATAI